MHAKVCMHKKISTRYWTGQGFESISTIKITKLTHRILQTSHPSSEVSKLCPPLRWCQHIPNIQSFWDMNFGISRNLYDFSLCRRQSKIIHNHELNFREGTRHTHISTKWNKWSWIMANISCMRQTWVKRTKKQNVLLGRRSRNELMVTRLKYLCYPRMGHIATQLRVFPPSLKASAT